MPLPISHGFFGATIVAAIHPKINKFYSIPLFIGGLFANLADFDFIIVLLTGDKSWHRGFSHSILFSLIIFFGIIIFLWKDHLREAIAFGLAYFSHAVLDYLTTKIGGGLELFWFFSSDRFGLRWFGLSEIPSKLSATEILQTIGVEFLLFGSLFGMVFWIRKYIYNQSNLPGRRF